MNVIKPKYSKELAELVGIMLGDGGIYYNKKHDIVQITVTGHKYNDKEYFENFVSPLFMKTLAIRMIESKVKGINGIRLRNQRKDAAKILQTLGIPIGDKKQKNAKIPEWIFTNKEFLKACLRGIIDTDGSLAPKTKYHPGPSIWITCKISSLRRTITKAFKGLGYHPSKWTLKKKECCLGRFNEVIKFYKEIGFNNPYHRKRFVGF